MGPKPNLSVQTLARDVVRTYIENLRLILALGRDYGFECLFYWQPVVFAKPQRTAYESKSIDIFHERYHGARTLYNEAYAAIAALASSSPPEGFHDLSDLFATASEPYYIDWSHLSEAGNAVVAERMGRDISARLDSSRR